MSSPPLAPAVASATAVAGQTLQALVRLAEALGTPGTVTAALAEAKAALAEAEVAVARLEAALRAAMGKAAAMEVPTPGLDAEDLYRKLGVFARTSGAELEQELRRNRRRRWWLCVARNVALALLLVCTPLLSLDAVREVLGVTQESQLVPCLATVTLICQAALWGAGTSKRHLAAAVRRYRQQELRYNRLARASAAATAATAEATEAIAAANVTLGMLEEVAGQLRTLVDAVTEDLEMARGFPASARALGDAVVALGTVMGDKEGTQKLERVLEALPGDE